MDYKALLIKYIDYVRVMEGTDFISDIKYSDFSDDEKKELEAMAVELDGQMANGHNG